MNHTSTESSSSRNLARKLATYAVTGAAATTAGVNAADASISDSSTTITVSTVGDSFDFDVDGDGTNDFTIGVAGTFNGAGAPNSTFFTITGFGANMAALGGATFNGVNNYVPAFGSTSSPGTFGLGAAMQSAGVLVVRYPTTGGNHYVDGTVAALPAPGLGLAFDISGATHFGALTFNITAGTPSSIAFNFQWEKDPGQSFVYPVPEPSGIALLALGAVGLVRRRNRAS